MRWTEEQLKAYQDARKAGGKTVSVQPGQMARTYRVSTPDDMNKLEARYAESYLYPRKLTGEIIDYKFQPLKFRLAKACFYTVDFLVICPDQMEIHEVKGHWEDDARVKWKTAAEMFPWFRFVAVQWVRGQWKFEYYH